MKPSNETEPPTPLPTPPIESLPASMASTEKDELIERLLEANAELRAANERLESQLTSALESNRTPLLHYGQDERATALNARSIGSMWLQPEVDQSGNHERATGQFAVMADLHALTDYLPKPQATAEHKLAVAKWAAALEPPAKQ